ncbi:MAG: IMP dehydrogenase [Thaumarchaeota archaeon]|nr:IMP dehydrogenase [Nitrososphaerota archaeon]
MPKYKQNSGCRLVCLSRRARDSRSDDPLRGLRTGLTFDDVLLVPKYSTIRSRKEASTATNLTKNIKLSVPIISANMDTVTDSLGEKTIAREGGIGIIHRFMSVEEQAAQVSKVKRTESILIEKPYTLGESALVADVKNLMRERNVGGILIVSDDGRLKGIVTTRDLRFQEDPSTPVTEVMTKRSDLVVASKKTTIEQAREIMQKTKVEKLPLVDKEDRLGGLITAKDILKRKQFPNATKDSKGRLRVGAAVGVKGDFLERAKQLEKEEVDVLVLDIAHGHSQHAIDAMREIKKTIGSSVELIAGNVATREGTVDLIKAGADSIKVGVGSGSICITRIVTGSGVPQLTAITDCAKATSDAGATLIADGGIRNSGDLTKALVAGADSVMVGSLLAGTDESPGEIVFRGNYRYKVTRGMASASARRDQLAVERAGRERSLSETTVQENVDLTDYVPEGVEAIVPYKGGAVSVIRQLVGGLRSGLSYCGASNLRELRRNGEFIRITDVGLKESLPHDVKDL